MADSDNSNPWFEWLKALIIAIVLAFILRNFVFAISIVDGNSMNPALHDGERILFNKFIYLVSDPERGDIVIIKHPDKNYVKRIVGLPNETIEMKDATLYIDGKKIEIDNVSELNLQLTGSFGPELIPADSYFVMGDNRAVSRDSRNGKNGLGLINRNEIVGRSELIVYPLSEIARTR